MSARSLGVWYGLWMAVLAGVFYAFPGQQMTTWAAIGVSSAVAVVVGVLRNRPRRAVPWLLLAGAILALVAGDTVYNVLTGVLGQVDPFPSWCDGIYLLVNSPLSAAGLLLLARPRTSQDRASLLDALTLTVGLGLLSFIFIINPYVQNPELSLVEKSISVAYPLYDVLLLAIVARVLVSVRASPAAFLLGLGGAGLLGADVLYGLLQLEGVWRTGTGVDLLWILFYAAWGGAALHPSMTRLTEPRAAPEHQISIARLALINISSLIAPAVLLIEAASGHVRDATVIALASAVMFVLVLARLAGVVGVHRRALDRERGLRQAGAALVSATSVHQVVAAVRVAVVRLMPPDEPHRVVLAGAGDVAAPPDTAPPETADPEPADPELADPEAVGPEPAARPAAGRAQPRTPARLTQLVYVRDLTGMAAHDLGDFEVAARCPLRAGDAAGADPRTGALLVAAGEHALIALQGSLEVLASQAALALERIALSDEINQRRSEEYFRTLVQNSSDVVLIVADGPAYQIRYASPSAAQVLGFEELAGTLLADLVHPDDRTLAGQMLALVRSGSQPVGGGDWKILRPDGSLVQVEASCRDLRQDPTVDGLVLTLRDVTERRRLERELTHRAFHDSLTGLANRTLLMERTEQAVARCARTGGTVGILVIDLDDFQVINDALGHKVGDELLTAVGQRLVELLRAHDTVARVGGDDFAVLVEDLASPVAVEEVAGRVVAALAKPFSIGNGLINGAASVGLATTAEADDAHDLLRHADLALHVAKKAGKGRFCRYQPYLHAALEERMKTRAALDQAVADGAFVLHYQPIVDLARDLTVGFEALVRWDDPPRGLVSPSEFIEVAEESGLIVPIGDLVLEQAVASAVRWAPAPGGVLPYVAVNVSARQFRIPGFVEKVAERLAASGLPARRLVLEITESLLLREDEQVWRDLTALRETGIRIAIDDFGTGYSSLSYLRQLPIDILKIDRSFISTITTSAQQYALVDGIVRLAHTLGLTTVAEGIEEECDRAALQAMGCQFGQGYLFARPLANPDAVRWLRDRHAPAIAS